MISIRRYLLGSLLAVSTAGMVVTGWLAWLDAAHEVEELFDAQLAQSARVLLASISSRPMRMEADEDDTVVFPVWEGHDGNGEDEAAPSRDPEVPDWQGHKYESRLMFQLWEGEGERLLMRSVNAPPQPLGGFMRGYGTTRVDGELFHTFVVERDGLWLLMAQDDYIRSELSAQIAIAALLPHAVGIPLLALLVWVLVGRGLAPLEALRGALTGRSADNLAPLAAGVADARELQPLVAELNRLLARLQESFARERRFTADAAHELRTPLAVLRIHAENALAATGDVEREVALRHLLGGVERAARLVEQLLTMARLEPEGSVPAREPVALAALLREEIAALVPMALRRGQDIELEADETLPAVAGDPLLLGVLARNLVDNALRYSPDDTTVRVSLAPVQGGVALRVQDQGPGIPADAVERVFERFWRAQSGRGDGAGLGLAIVRRIAELHGGTVAAVPRRGDQAGCLEVVLPARG